MDDTRFSLPRIAVVRSSSSGHSHERRPSEVPLLEESQLGLEKQQHGRPPTPSKEGLSKVHYAPASQEEDEARTRSSEPLPHVERGPVIRRTGNRDSITRLLHGSLTQAVNGRRRRLVPGFEPPSYLHLVLLAILCALAYAVLVLVSALADKQSIFWARFIVAAGCTFSGLSISTVLLLMARKVLEAATWATVIHQSRLNGSPGIRLKDLNAHSYAPMLVWPALRLLWDRWVYPGAARKERTHYDRHAWSLYLLLFILSCIIAAWTPFALGRTVFIKPSTLPQQRQFQEVSVLGPLSETELDTMNQLLPMMKDQPLQWTLGPQWGSSTRTLSFEWANYLMYLPEVRWDQVGSWLQSEPASSSAILRYPRWGVRVRCASSKDTAVSIVPNARSNVSYVFTPREVVRKLFGDLQVPFPAQLQRHPNWTEVMNGGDLLPAGLDLMSTALAERFPHDGNSFSLKNYAMDADPSWQGFASVEITLVRLNASFAPQGRFTRVTAPPQGEVLDGSGRPTYIGYDASVCLLAYEPWVMEVHHRGSGFLETQKCLGRGARVEDFDLAIQRQERVGPEWKGNNSEGWDVRVRRPAFTVAHQNAVTNMAKGANGGQGSYTPSSMIVSFTNGGSGPYNYTSLSGEAYAHRRALAASAFTLPHLLGSSTQLARRYLDDQVSSTSLSHGAVGIVIGSLLALGMILTFFVPSLPGNWPRRGFDLHSWFVAMQTGEIVASREDVIMQKGMDLSDPNIVRPLGQMRLRFIEGYGRT